MRTDACGSIAAHAEKTLNVYSVIVNTAYVPLIPSVSCENKLSVLACRREAIGAGFRAEFVESGQKKRLWGNLPLSFTSSKPITFFIKRMVLPP